MNLPNGTPALSLHAPHSVLPVVRDTECEHETTSRDDIGRVLIELLQQQQHFRVESLLANHLGAQFADADSGFFSRFLNIKSSQQ